MNFSQKLVVPRSSSSSAACLATRRISLSSECTYTVNLKRLRMSIKNADTIGITKMNITSFGASCPLMHGVSGSILQPTGRSIMEHMDPYLSGLKSFLTSPTIPPIIGKIHMRAWILNSYLRANSRGDTLSLTLFKK